MSRKEVIVKTVAGELTWIQAADILGITARHLRRLKQRWERHGYDGLVDYRGGKPAAHAHRAGDHRAGVHAQAPALPGLLRAALLGAAGPPVHGLEISYTWTRSWPCRRPGSWPGVRGRGQYRRAAGAPPAVRDDGTPRCLAPRLAAAAADAGTWWWLWTMPTGGSCTRALCPRRTRPSTLAALKHLLRRYGRFAELYTDRASHFCYTPKAGDGPHHRAWRGRQPGAEGAGDPPAAGLVPASARAQRARLRDQSRAACRRSCGWRGVAATSTPTPT